MSDGILAARRAEMEGIAAWLRKQAKGDLAEQRRLVEAYAPNVEREGDWLLFRAQERVAACEATLAVLTAWRAAVDQHAKDQAEFGRWVLGMSVPEAPRRKPGTEPYVIPGLEMAVRLLASGYRHRDGWQEAWKP